MSNEHTLISATERAARAERLLNDDLLKEAFETLEQAYIAGWRATTVEDMAGREKLFLAINVLGKVKDHLTQAVNGGKIANAELKQLRNTAERTKRFGIV